MNKQIIIEQIAALSETYKLGLGSDTLERIVMHSTFLIVEKGTLLRSIGDSADTAALVLDGMARCYYIDGDGKTLKTETFPGVQFRGGTQPVVINGKIVFAEKRSKLKYAQIYEIPAQ